MKRYVYMVVNSRGEPLYTNVTGNITNVGRLWFFLNRVQAIAYIQRRNSKGLDLDKYRTIVRVDFQLLFKESKVVWTQIEHS